METCGRKLTGLELTCQKECDSCRYKVIGAEVAYQNGCYSRVRYWFRSWIHDFPGWPTFTNGWSGPETIITIDHIQHTFEVIKPT
jgi:hypothetical protein